MDTDIYNTHFEANARKALRLALYVIGVGLFISWIIGALGLSIAWLLLLGLALISWFWNFAILKPLQIAWFHQKYQMNRCKALREDETAEWLNILVNQWFQLNSENLMHAMKKLEEFFNKYKPSFVEKFELVEMSLGKEIPIVRSLRAYHVVKDKRLPLGLYNIDCSRQLALEFDLISDSKDFRIVLRVKLCGTGINFDVEIAMENFKFIGRGDLLVTIDPSVSFPYIAKSSFRLVNKPVVSFQLQVFKGIQLMEVPLLKNWLQNFVTQTFELKLVDPGYIDLPGLFRHLSAKTGPQKKYAYKSAEGVLTVSITSDTNSDNWIVISLNENQVQIVKDSEKVCFLCEDIEKDILMIEVKNREYVDHVLGKYEMLLLKYNLKTSSVVETCLECQNLPDIMLKLEYTQLVNIKPEINLTEGCGILNVHVHNARLNQDVNNPYCAIFINNQLVHETQYVNEKKNPVWENQCQVVTKNVNEATMKFLVYSWDAINCKSVSIAGFAYARLKDENSLIRRSLQFIDCDGSITITVTFQQLNSSPKKTAKVEPELNRVRVDRKMKLGIPVPPPTPPPFEHRFLRNGSVSNGDSNSVRSLTSSLHSINDSTEVSPLVNESVDNQAYRNTRDLGFQSMRLKMSKSLRLLRFKSESNIRSVEEKTLDHALSQPDITKYPTGIPNIPSPPKHREINSRPDTYTGVEGRVVQAQGLHVAHVSNLSCRVRLLLGASKKDGKTVSESRLIPAMPNPQFNLDFQITSPEVVPRTAVLLFEIRGSGKDVVASRKATLQDLLSGELKEAHTWLALNNGATLQVNIAQGKVFKKKSKKLFRSWSVHRIGRI